MQTVTEPVDALAGLTSEFPGWHIWRGRDGRGQPKGWFVTGRQRLRADELDAGLTGRLIADDAESLRSQLAQQQVIEQRTADSAL